MKSNGTWAPKRGSERDLQTWDVGCGEWRVNVDDSLTESGYPVAAATWGSGDCTGPRAKRIESRGSNRAPPSGDVDGDLPKIPSFRHPPQRPARPRPTFWVRCFNVPAAPNALAACNLASLERVTLVFAPPSFASRMAASPPPPPSPPTTTAPAACTRARVTTIRHAVSDTSENAAA